MEWRQPCPYGWRRCLVFFLGLLLAEAVHGAGSEAAAPRLVPAEVRVLRHISARLGISNWDFVAGPCDYGGSGVHCDCSFSNGTVCHVTEIFLRGKNFSGELPPHFANLPNLLQLDLSRSLFHGGVPDQWAQMKLQGLSLMGNRLSGPFPMVLTKITTLTNLSIERNGFYGPIPPEIGHLFQMEKLILSANEFTGPLPTALSLFSNLTDLRISSTNFSGRLPEFWGKLKRLEKLQIEGSFLEGPIPLSLSELKNLSDLRVSDLRGSGSAFPYLIGMQSMRTLDLSFNKLSGEIPDSFAKLTGVDYIYLTGNSLTGNIPGWLLTRNKIANLESILDSLQLSDDPDGRECHGVGDGNTLRSSSIYQMLRAKESPASPMSEFVWSSRAPPRVQFFGWLVSRERIQCRSNLVKRKIVPDDLCQVCGNSPETTSHVLLRCGFATEFWRKVGVELDASDEGAMLHRLRRPASLPEEGFNTFLLLCCWQLWKRRNAWVFRDEQASMTTTFRRCREDAMLWKVRFKKRGDEIASAWCSAFSEN